MTSFGIASQMIGRDRRPCRSAAVDRCGNISPARRDCLEIRVRRVEFGADHRCEPVIVSRFCPRVGGFGVRPVLEAATVAKSLFLYGCQLQPSIEPFPIEFTQIDRAADEHPLRFYSLQPEYRPPLKAQLALDPCKNRLDDRFAPCQQALLFRIFTLGTLPLKGFVMHTNFYFTALLVLAALPSMRASPIDMTSVNPHGVFIAVSHSCPPVRQLLALRTDTAITILVIDKPAGMIRIGLRIG